MTQKVAGVYFFGNKLSRFIACIFDFYAPGNRWILDELYFSENEKNSNSPVVFEEWIKTTEIADLIINVPMTSPICETCQLICPGEEKCHHPVIKSIRHKIVNELDKDFKLEKSNPKAYERYRDNMSKYSSDHKFFNRGNSDPLSKSLKKKLRKGFTPYWSRPIDLYIWLNYYDELIQIFNYSYDSFGQTSLMNLKRFSYLKRHLKGINVWESSIHINFLEMLKSDILLPEDLIGMKYVDEFSVSNRKKIVSKLETSLNIFIKMEDTAIFTFDPKAINALNLGLCAIRNAMSEKHQLPDWCQGNHPNFIIPNFSLDG